MKKRADFLAGGNRPLSLRERKAIAREVSERYRKASKKQKGEDIG